MPLVAEKAVFPRTPAWDRPGFLLWHATLRWQRAAAAVLEPLGLTHMQFRLLASVMWLERNDGPPSQRELADHAGIDAMMTSQVVRALEKAGLLSRTADATDSRIKRLTCTAAGRRVARGAITRIEEIDDIFFGRNGQRESSIDSLRRLAGRDERGEIIDERWTRA
jgi:DNA-binding MarR family transcriptional regulator